MRVNHPDVSLSEQTWLSLPATAADATLTVQSNNTFAVNDYITVGVLGQERTELRKVSAVAGATSITLTGSALIFDHPTNIPVTQIRYNKIKVYASSSENGSFTEISGSPFDIDVDKLFTSIYNPSETSSTWYKITYFNSSNFLESDYSDTMRATGPSEGSVRDLITSVRRDCKLGDDNNVVSDDDIIDIFNECQKYLQNKKGFVKQEAIATLSSVINSDYYELPTDVLKIRDLSVTVGTNIYYPEYYERDQFNFNEQVGASQNSIPNFYTLWGNRLYIRPLAASTGTNNIKILYYKKLTTLDSDNDVPELSQTEILIFYANQVISAIRENWKAVAFWEKKFELSFEELLTTGSIKQKTRLNRTRRTSNLSRSNTNWPRTIG